MIYYSLQVVENLLEVLFSNSTVQDMIDAAEDIIYNPMSFVPVGENMESIHSKGFPEDNRIYYDTDTEHKKYQQFEMDAFAKMEDNEPFYSPGAPGLKYRHILHWVKDATETYGRLAIAQMKIPLEDIDKELVRFISKCIAQKCKLQSPHKSAKTRHVLFEKLISGEINGHVALMAEAGDISLPTRSSYRLACFPIDAAYADKSANVLLPYFAQIMPHCWYMWDKNNIVLLIDMELHPVYGEKSCIEHLKFWASINHSAVCIGAQFTDLVDCYKQYQYILFLPAYRKAREGEVIYYDDYPECGLIYESNTSRVALEEYYSKTL
jgi:hypothetical protein